MVSWYLYLYWFYSLALQASEHPPPSHFHLVSIPDQWLFWKDVLAQHLTTRSTALKSHKSRAPLVHHLIPFTDPRAKHQALAPSLPIPLNRKLMFVTALLTFNASARACGQKWWQTTLNLRNDEAICDTYIKPCRPPQIWSQDHESKSRWIVAKTRYSLILLLEVFSSFTSVRTPAPVPIFHLVSIPNQWLFWKHAQARHLSNCTRISQVSSTTGTPLDSIHRPPCQAPGLGSFIANFIVPQVDLRKSLVDLQCFGKGLWTKTMANHEKSENLQIDLRH